MVFVLLLHHVHPDALMACQAEGLVGEGADVWLEGAAGDLQGKAVTQ